MKEPRLSDEFRERIDAVTEPLRPAQHPGEAARRARIVENMREARQEIAQIFIDVEHWNTHVRKPHENLIEADPHGDLKRVADFYDRILKRETQ